MNDNFPPYLRVFVSNPLTDDLTLLHNAANNNKHKTMRFFTERTSWEQRETIMAENDTPHPEPKANESAASQHQDKVHAPNKLDKTQAVEPFGQAAGTPNQPTPDKPEASLQLNTPSPGGNAPVSPQLRDEGDKTQDARDAFKKQMLARKEFRDNARDVTERDR